MQAFWYQKPLMWYLSECTSCPTVVVLGETTHCRKIKYFSLLSSSLHSSFVLLRDNSCPSSDYITVLYQSAPNDEQPGKRLRITRDKIRERHRTGRVRPPVEVQEKQHPDINAETCSVVYLALKRHICVIPHWKWLTRSSTCRLGQFRRHTILSCGEGSVPGVCPSGRDSVSAVPRSRSKHSGHWVLVQKKGDLNWNINHHKIRLRTYSK